MTIAALEPIPVVERTKATAVEYSAWRPVALVALQLAMLAICLRLFQLESSAFFRTMLLAFGAYPVVALAPRERRMPLFALLSLAGVGLVLGTASLWVFGIGGLLLLVAHLPISWRWRVLALLIVSGALVLARSKRLPLPAPPEIWAIAGSLFMFRLILYMQAIGQGTKPTVASTVAYFFMLPNAVFPLFPIVDYKLFQSAWYDGDGPAIAQEGVRWIVRGVLHLLGYRLIYHNVVLETSAVVTFPMLLQYVFSTFFLYLKVSGTFHIAVGVLHLFGFRLPETHHLYVLATNFSDLWRRINIYWKDFMMKAVYYPAYFRLRRFGHQRALLLSTALVFVATWALHAYQWFWLLGTKLLTAPDILFWTILGVLVVAQSYRDIRTPRRSAKVMGWSWGRGLSVLTTFGGLLVLWSMWSTDTLAEWWAMWRVLKTATAAQLLLFGVGVAAFVGFAGFPWGERQLGQRSSTAAPTWRHVGATGLLLLFAVVVRSSAVASVGPILGGVVGTLSDAQLNAKDRAELNRGYYEALTRGNQVAGASWALKTDMPADWVELRSTPAIEPRADYLVEALRPNVRLVYKGRVLTTNAAGMRDRDYALQKAPDVYRIAILGPSDVMGAGVADGETFEARLESRLNAGRRNGTTRFEVLNFAVEAYSLQQQLYMLEQRALPYRPDLVLISAHEVDPIYHALHLSKVLAARTPIPYPEIADLVARTGVNGSMEYTEVRRRFRAVDTTITRLSIDRVGQLLRTNQIRGGVMLLREPTTQRDPLTAATAAARQAGLAVLDLQSAYPANFEPAYRLAQWDRHPNALGHEQIALALEQALRSQATLLGIPLSPNP